MQVTKQYFYPATSIVYTSHLPHHQTFHTQIPTLLRRDLKVPINDSHGQQDPGPAPQRPQHIARDGQRTDDRTAERSSSGDHALQFFVHALLAMARHNETLILELLGDITGRGARDFNPCLRENSTRHDDERDVHDRVDGVEEGVGEIQRWGHVVSDTGGGEELRGPLARLPHADKLDEQVVGEARVQHLADHEDVGR